MAIHKDTTDVMAIAPPALPSPQVKVPAPMLGMLENSAVLAAAGGFLDGFTYVGHGHVFANAMTGNVVLLGINCISGEWRTGLRHLPPIASFLLGISAAKALQLPAIKRFIREPDLAALTLENCILLVVSLLPVTTPDMWITASIAFAASVQVETFREVNGHSYNSTFATGNLRTLGGGAFDWFFRGQSPEKARLVRDFALVCAAFLLGAAVGGDATARFGNRALWLEIAMLLFVAVRIWPWNTVPRRRAA